MTAPPGSLSLPEQILRYGHSVRDFFHAGQRATLMSPLFNVPARLVLGSHCYYEHLPWLLQQITAAAEPEQLGRRMKVPAMRPNYVNLNALMLGYFNGREQRRLLAGLPPGQPLPDEDASDHEAIIDFWHRAATAYVEGGSYLPLESGYRLAILPPAEIDRLAQGLRPQTDAERRATRRLISIVELYTFILNGEARVGVFHHGPYPLPDGDVIVVKELVGLRDDFLPWQLDDRPQVDALTRVMRLRDVDVHIDLSGSLIATPLEYDERIIASRLLARSGEQLHELTEEQAAQIEQAAGDGQLHMYQQAATWSADYQIAYGADLYAALALSFAHLAGLNLDEQVKTRFHDTAKRIVPGLRDGHEPLLILKALGASTGNLYTP